MKTVTSLEPPPPVRRKFPRSDAIAVAKELCDALKPVCERLLVAGSLRRMKAFVGDVELLYVPKVKQAGLFADDLENLADGVISRLLSGKVIVERPNSKGIITWGPLNKLAIHRESGIPVDLFATTEHCWWNAVVVRTGGVQSNLILTRAALDRGWSLEAYGSGFSKLDGSEHYQTTSERDVFNFVRLPYREPKDRP